MEQKIKIAALGSCVSRDPFNSIFNEDWKDNFEFTAYQFQGSVISLMSDIVSYPTEDFQWTDHVPRSTRWALYSELNKAYLSDLYYAQPDYLLIDLYTDVFYGMRDIGESIIMNKRNAIRYNTLLSNYKVNHYYHMLLNQKKYIALFQTKLDQFMRFCRQYLPNTTLIINSARFQHYYIDEARQRHKLWRYPKGILRRLNKAWDCLEEYIFTHYDVLQLKHDEKIYYAAEHHPFGDKFPLHYEKEFYQALQQKLMALIVECERCKKQCHRSLTSYNLVQNHDFSFNTASWQGFESPCFKIEHHRIDICEYEGYNYQSVSSYPILKTTNEYELSFDIHFMDISQVNDNDAIFVIRTFQRPEQLAYKSSCEQHIITKKEVSTYINKHHTTTFKKRIIVEQGKYLKLMPYIVQHGHYQIGNITCYALPIYNQQKYTLNEMILRKKK